MYKRHGNRMLSLLACLCSVSLANPFLHWREHRLWDSSIYRRQLRHRWDMTVYTVIPELGRRRQANPWDSLASVAYLAGSRPRRDRISRNKVEGGLWPPHTCSKSEILSSQRAFWLGGIRCQLSLWRGDPLKKLWSAFMDGVL